jgi:branched-chain amino acid transport system ATP-binding protein
MNAAVELRGIHARYEEIEVLHGIDLTVGQGMTFAIMGPNGAGKTTLLRVMAGLHPTFTGEANVAGRPVSVTRADRLVRNGVCLVPEGRGVFPNLSVEEHVWMMTYSGKRRRSVEEVVYERFPILQERRRQPAGTLSGGEQQMLALARAMATEPSVLLLDELSMGLAPMVVDSLYEHIATLARTGVTIVIVEQFLRYVSSIAERAAVLVGGRVMADGTPDEIAPTLKEAYLEGSAARRNGGAGVDGAGVDEP